MKLRFKAKLVGSGSIVRVPEFKPAHVVDGPYNTLQFHMALRKIYDKNPELRVRNGAQLVENLPPHVKQIGTHGFLTEFEVDLTAPEINSLLCDVCFCVNNEGSDRCGFCGAEL